MRYKSVLIALICKINLGEFLFLFEREHGQAIGGRDVGIQITQRWHQSPRVCNGDIGLCQCRHVRPFEEHLYISTLANRVLILVNFRGKPLGYGFYAKKAVAALKTTQEAP